MHEIGHNLFLNHAGIRGDRGYGDYSGTMGFCCDTRCYSTPHSYQLGWAGPVATLHAGNFKPGRWAAYSLPASITAAKHFLRVKGDWNNVGGSNHIFVSYRFVFLCCFFVFFVWFVCGDDSLFKKIKHRARAQPKKPPENGSGTTTACASPRALATASSSTACPPATRSRTAALRRASRRARPLSTTAWALDCAST